MNVPWESGERVRGSVPGLSKNLFQETFTRMDSQPLVPSSSSNCKRTAPSGDFGYFISCSVIQLAVLFKLRSSNCKVLEDRDSTPPCGGDAYPPGLSLVPFFLCRHLLQDKWWEGQSNNRPLPLGFSCLLSIDFAALVVFEDLATNTLLPLLVLSLLSEKSWHPVLLLPGKSGDIWISEALLKAMLKSRQIIPVAFLLIKCNNWAQEIRSVYHHLSFRDLLPS